MNDVEKKAMEANGVDLKKRVAFLEEAIDKQQRSMKLSLEFGESLRKQLELTYARIDRLRAEYKEMVSDQP